MPILWTRRLVMFCCIIQAGCVMTVQLLDHSGPQGFGIPLLDNFVMPLFGTTWVMLTVTGVVQGLATWWKD